MSHDPFLAEADPFGIAAIRDRVLAAWTAAPVRFREDANAEEDFALGGYRDRLVVELAQNAADAAVAAGVPGRLLLALSEIEGRAVLVAANTGRPLDAAGVQALATLRASAKRDGSTVGRFGVGFAAVLAVSDEPALVSRPAACGSPPRTPATWSVRPRPARPASPRSWPGVTATSRCCGCRSRPAARRRRATTPRWCCRCGTRSPRTPPPGCWPRSTTRCCSALPGLAEIVVRDPGRADPHRPRRRGALARAAPRRGLRSRAAGRPADRGAGADRLATGLGAAPGRPRRGARRAARPDPERRSHCPGRRCWWRRSRWTPTAGTSRPGPPPTPWSRQPPGVRRTAAERAAAGDAAWPLVPSGLASGTLDGALREAVLPLLRRAPLIPSPAEPGLLLRPRDAVALEPPTGDQVAVVGALARWVPSLVLAPRAATAAFAALGVRRVPLSDVVEALPDQGAPGRWRECYAALEPLADDVAARESLAAVPVPLADGRVVGGPRGLVLLGDPQLGPAAAALGVRVVHPDAAHPLLDRLGAVRADAREVLELPAVRAAVEDSPDADDPARIAEAVLLLARSAVEAHRLAPGDLPWLGELALPDGDGELAPASTLAVPGSLASEVFDPDEIAPVHADLPARWGVDVLAAAGVLTRPALLREDEVLLDADAVDLDGWAQWAAEAGNGAPDAVLGELLAVRDLDAVDSQRWPALLSSIAADRDLRAAVVAPARVRRDGRVLDLPPYTAWWLRRNALAAGGPVLDADAGPELRPLLPLAPAWLAALDGELRRALGVVREIGDLDAGAVSVVLDALADESVQLAAADLLRLYAGLAGIGRPDPEPPELVRVPHGAGSRVVPAGEAVVLDAPMYAQRPDLGAGLPAPAALAGALADLLDLPLASERAPGLLDERDQVTSDVPPLVGQLLPTGPRHWCEHDQLLVDGVEVAWWVVGSGPGATVHAATLRGLSRGLAWASGQWPRRYALAELLAGTADAGDVIADEFG